MASSPSMWWQHCCPPPAHSSLTLRWALPQQVHGPGCTNHCHGPAVVRGRPQHETAAHHAPTPLHTQVEARPPGPLQDPRVSLTDPKKFFGVKGFGFTKVRRRQAACGVDTAACQALASALVEGCCLLRPSCLHLDLHRPMSCWWAVWLNWASQPP